MSDNRDSSRMHCRTDTRSSQRVRRRPGRDMETGRLLGSSCLQSRVLRSQRAAKDESQHVLTVRKVPHCGIRGGSLVMKAGDTEVIQIQHTCLNSRY